MNFFSSHRICFLCCLLYGVAGWALSETALPCTTIAIGTEILSVELAQNTASWAHGLMGRSTLAEGNGMLFVYPESRKLKFWMKNTTIPLSIGFFDSSHRLLNVVDMSPLTGTSYSNGYAQYALEVPQGWFTKHKILPGEKFSFLDPEDAINCAQHN